MQRKNDWTKDIKINVIPKDNGKKFNDILYSQEVKSLISKMLTSID